MKHFFVLIFLINSLMLLTSCNEAIVKDTPSLYGQRPTADRAYVDVVNQESKKYIGDYSSDSFTDYLNIQLSSPTEGMCEADDYDDSKELADYVKEQEDKKDEEAEIDLNNKPKMGGPVRSELPKIKLGSEEMKKVGYYRYKDKDRKVFGTKRTIWRIETAGKILAKENITMGIGDISSKGGRTKGHAEHQQGQDVDLRLISKDGTAKACRINQKCYDREKTFKMIKTLIDTDPLKVDKVLINDRKLRNKINAYYRKKTGSRRKISKSCEGHDDHVHMSWKRS